MPTLEAYTKKNDIWKKAKEVMKTVDSIDSNSVSIDYLISMIHTTYDELEHIAGQLGFLMDDNEDLVQAGKL